MEQYLKRYFWVIQLALIVGIAILAAMSLSNLGGALLAPFGVVAPPPPGDTAAKGGDGSATRLSDLDSARFSPKPKEGDEPVVEASPEVEGDDEPVLGDDEYPLSDLRVQLRGTMVADDPRWSMALLYDEASRASFRTRIGEKFLEVVKVVRIDRDRVVIDRDGRLEQIEIDTKPGKPGARRKGLTSKPPSSSVSKPSWKSPAGVGKSAVSKIKPPMDKIGGLRKGITKKSETKFEVSRDTLNTALKNPGKFRDGTRPVPKYDNGRLSGFELTKMTSGSIFSDLGMRNGDIITSINGKKIRTPNDALRMYQKLSSSSEVKIGYKRNGVERENSYSIR